MQTTDQQDKVAKSWKHIEKGYRPFTQAQLDWWMKNNKPQVSKFHGVEEKSGKFYANGKEIIPEEDIQEFLHKLYSDPKIGLTSKGKFWEYVRYHYAGIPRSYVDKYLMTNETYQKFRPAIKQHATTKPNL